MDVCAEEEEEERKGCYGCACRVVWCEGGGGAREGRGRRLAGLTSSFHFAWAGAIVVLPLSLLLARCSRRASYCCIAHHFCLCLYYVWLCVTGCKQVSPCPSLAQVSCLQATPSSRHQQRKGGFLLHRKTQDDDSSMTLTRTYRHRAPAQRTGSKENTRRRHK